MKDRKTAPKPSPEDIARVAAARFVAGLPDDAARSREIAREMARAEPVTDAPLKSRGR